MTLLPPDDLQAYGFFIGSDEYVLLAFPASLPRVDWQKDERLSATERTIALLAVQGRSNAEIALARGTSPRTIANQLAVIYRKLGVRSRRELISTSVVRTKVKRD